MRLLRNLSRRKLRTGLTIAGITIGIWALVVFSSMAAKIDALVSGGSRYYADKIVVTGKKADEKMYWRHSGYPGGIKGESYRHLLARRPEEIVRRAVKGMLPHNKLGAAQYRKLKVYAGPDHPHVAQNPEPLEIKE